MKRMPSFKRKVLAYVTHGDRLLVFRHADFPEAGVQVPAGTVEPGERAEEAVMREAREETGLSDLRLVRLLGERTRDMTDYGRDEVHHRWFYHVLCEGNPPTAWRHQEIDPADGGPPIVFELFWARLPDGVPELIADQGSMLPDLMESMAQES